MNNYNVVHTNIQTFTETIKNVKKICEVESVWKKETLQIIPQKFNSIRFKMAEKTKKNFFVKENATKFPTRHFYFKCLRIFPSLKHTSKHTHLPHENHSQRTHSTNETQTFQEKDENDSEWKPLHLLAALFPSHKIGPSVPESMTKPQRFTSAALGSIVNVASFREQQKN